MRQETLHRPSQKQRVLDTLRNAGPSGVCGTSLLYINIPRYAARIHELRQAGHQIASTQCGDSHTTRQTRYTLHA